jgi:hypothetical protein
MRARASRMRQPAQDAANATGPYLCAPSTHPTSLTMFYALAFSTAVIAFRPIELGTGACATVSGLDAEGTRIIQSATVWSNLATALNLSPATEQSFEGTT